MKSVLLILSISGTLMIGVVSVLAQMQIHTFSYSVTNKPIVYQDNVYGFSSTNHFFKASLVGHVFWEIPIKQKNVKRWKIKFKQVMFLTEKGDLQCYDAEYGHKLWEKTGLQAKKVIFSYPMIYFSDASHHLGAVSFFSGNLAWRQKNVVAKEFIVSHQSEEILVVEKEHLTYLSSGRGNIVRQTKLSFYPDQLIASTNTDIYYIKGAVMYAFSEGLVSKKHKEYLISNVSQVVQERWLAYETDPSEMGVIDLKKNSSAWHYGASSKTTDFKTYINNDQIAILDEKSQLKIFQIQDGILVLEKKVVIDPEIFPSLLYWTEKAIYFFYPQKVIEVPRL